MHGKFNKQRGVVLVLVLGFISIVALLTASAADNQRFLLRKAAHVIDAEQARALADLALDTVEQQLLLDARISATDHLNEAWARTLPMPLPEATLWIEVVDIGRYWNINTIYNTRQGVSPGKLTLLEVALENRGQDPRVLGEVIDWIDANDEVSTFGSGRERDGYNSAGLQFGPRNGFMRNREELSLLPLWQLSLNDEGNQWLQASAACPDSRININTAARATLALLQPLLLSGRDIDFILEEREKAPFESVNEALTRIVYTGDPGKVAPLLAVSSDCFFVSVDVRVNRTSVTTTAELMRESTREQEIFITRVWQQWAN